MEKDNSKKLEKFEKNQIKANTKHILKSNLEFEKTYVNLYNELYNRFQIEFDNIQSLDKKFDFLQELMDSIIEANHYKKYRYNISEPAEESESKLNGLRDFFEVEMQKLIINKNLKNNPSIITLKDFFTEKITDNKIVEIQLAFKDVSIGKEMAILIHFLVKKELVKKFDNSNRNGKTGKSRLFFVRQFTKNKDLKDIKGINGFLDSDENLKKIKPTKTGIYLDEAYNGIKKQLDKIVSNS